MAYQIALQLTLQAPTNLGAVAAQISKGLSGVSIPVQVALSPAAQGQLNALSQRMNQAASGAGAVSAASNQAASSLANVGRAATMANAAVGTLVGSYAGLSRSLGTTNALLGNGAGYFERFGAAANAATQRFLAFAVGAQAVVGLVRAVREGVGAGIQFEQTLNKIAQVSGESDRALAAIRTRVGELATAYGTSSAELAKASLILAQTGISAKEVAANLETLALAAAAPNFGNMAQTVEGLIAYQRQWNASVDQTREAIGAMNEVAAKFPVEAGDLVTAIRKAGGAFATAGGDFNEFIALFTSVRSTTRESAEEIATGMRTIFARTQRADVIDELKALGIQLRYTAEEAQAVGRTDLTNQFVGPYEAVRRLNQELRNVPTTDPRYASVMESLGGYRQISRALPLIQQFSRAEAALGTAQTGSLSLYRSAEKAQETLYTQTLKTKEQFLELFRTITESNAFQQFARGALSLANTFATVLEYAKPLVPLLLTMGSIQIFRGITGFFANAAAGPPALGSMTRARGFNQGGLSPGGLSALTPGEFVAGPHVVQGMGKPALEALNQSGYVPGVGDGDTVPALLPPNSFVIRKRSVKDIEGKYGKGFLQKLGEAGRFADGGPVRANAGLLVPSRRYRRRFGDPAETLAGVMQGERDEYGIFSRLHLSDIHLANPRQFSAARELMLGSRLAYPELNRGNYDPYVQRGYLFDPAIRRGVLLASGDVRDKALQVGLLSADHLPDGSGYLSDRVAAMDVHSAGSGPAGSVRRKMAYTLENLFGRELRRGRRELPTNHTGPLADLMGPLDMGGPEVLSLLRLRSRGVYSYGTANDTRAMGVALSRLLQDEVAAGATLPASAARHNFSQGVGSYEGQLLRTLGVKGYAGGGGVGGSPSSLSQWLKWLAVKGVLNVGWLLGGHDQAAMMEQALYQSMRSGKPSLSQMVGERAPGVKGPFQLGGVVRANAGLQVPPVPQGLAADQAVRRFFRSLGERHDVDLARYQTSPSFAEIFSDVTKKGGAGQGARGLLYHDDRNRSWLGLSPALLATATGAALPDQVRYTAAHELGHMAEFQSGLGSGPLNSLIAAHRPNVATLVDRMNLWRHRRGMPVLPGEKMAYLLDDREVFADAFGYGTTGLARWSNGTVGNRQLLQAGLLPSFKDARERFEDETLPFLQKRFGAFDPAARYAKGGSVEDRVPALLTPGEVVIRRESVERIGAPALHWMNQHGELPPNLLGKNGKWKELRGYNTGGEVTPWGPQRLVGGGQMGPMPQPSKEQMLAWLLGQEQFAMRSGRGVNVQEMLRQTFARRMGPFGGQLPFSAEDVTQEATRHLSGRLGNFNANMATKSGRFPDFLSFVRRYAEQTFRDMVRKEWGAYRTETDEYGNKTVVQTRPRTGGLVTKDGTSIDADEAARTGARRDQGQLPNSVRAALNESPAESHARLTGLLQDPKANSAELRAAMLALTSLEERRALRTGNKRNYSAADTARIVQQVVMPRLETAMREAGITQPVVPTRPGMTEAQAMALVSTGPAQEVAQTDSKQRMRDLMRARRGGAPTPPVAAPASASTPYPLPVVWQGMSLPLVPPPPSFAGNNYRGMGGPNGAPPFIFGPTAGAFPGTLPAQSYPVVQRAEAQAAQLAGNVPLLAAMEARRRGLRSRSGQPVDYGPSRNGPVSTYRMTADDVTTFSRATSTSGTGLNSRTAKRPLTRAQEAELVRLAYAGGKGARQNRPPRQVDSSADVPILLSRESWRGPAWEETLRPGQAPLTPVPMPGGAGVVPPVIPPTTTAAPGADEPGRNRYNPPPIILTPAQAQARKQALGQASAPAVRPPAPPMPAMPYVPFGGASPRNAPAGPGGPALPFGAPLPVGPFPQPYWINSPTPAMPYVPFGGASPLNNPRGPAGRVPPTGVPAQPFGAQATPVPPLAAGQSSRSFRDIVAERAQKEAAQREADARARNGGQLSDQTRREIRRAAVEQASAEVTRELTSAQQNLLRATNKRLSATEAARMADEDVARARKRKAPMVVEGADGAILGTTGHVRSANAQGQTPPGAGGFWYGLGQLGSSVGKGLGRWSAWDQARVQRMNAMGMNPLMMSFGLSMAAPMLGSAFQSDPEVAVRTDRAGLYTTGQAASGALGGAAMGAMLGTYVPGFQLTGMLAGAAIGSLVGTFTSLRDAAKALQDVKVEMAVRVLADKLGVLAQLGQESPAGYQEAALREIDAFKRESAAGSYSQAGYFSFDPAKFSALEEKSYRQSYAPLVPAMQQRLQTQLRLLVREGRGRGQDGNYSGDLLLDQLRQNPLDSTLVQDLARLKKVSPKLVEDELRPQIANIVRQQQIETTQKQAFAGDQANAGTFGRLANSAVAATDSLRELRGASRTLAEAFEGDFRAAARPDIDAGALANLGSGSPEASDLLRLIRNVGGEQGAALARTGEAASLVERILPSVLTEVSSRSRGENANSELDFTTAVDRLLRERLGASFQDPYVQRAATGARSFIDQQMVGERRLAGVLDQVTTDVSGLAKRAVANSLGPVQEFGRRFAEPVIGLGTQYAEGLAGSRRQTEAVGAGRDRLAEMEAQLARLRAEIAGEEQYRRRGAQADLSLADRLSPFTGRQVRLAGEAGLAAGDAFSPAALAGRIQALTPQIISAQEKQREALLSGSADAYRDATKAVDSLRGQANAAVTALRALADSSGKLQAIQEQMQSLRGDREGRLGFAASYFGSDTEGRLEMQRGLVLANMANERGSLDGLMARDQSLVINTLRSMGGSQLTGFRDSPFASDLLERLLANTAGGVAKLAPDKQAELQRLQQQLLDEQRKAADAQTRLVGVMESAQREQNATLERLFSDFFSQLGRRFKEDQVADLQNRRGALAPERARLEKLSEARGVLADAGITTQGRFDEVQAQAGILKEYGDAIRKRGDIMSGYDAAIQSLERMSTQEVADKFSGGRGGDLAAIVGGQRQTAAQRASNIEDLLKTAGLGDAVGPIQAVFQNRARMAVPLWGTDEERGEAARTSLLDALRQARSQTRAQADADPGVGGGVVITRTGPGGTNERNFIDPRYLEATREFNRNRDRLPEDLRGLGDSLSTNDSAKKFFDSLDAVKNSGLSFATLDEKVAKTGLEFDSLTAQIVKLKAEMGQGWFSDNPNSPRTVGATSGLSDILSGAGGASLSAASGIRANPGWFSAGDAGGSSATSPNEQAFYWAWGRSGAGEFDRIGPESPWGVPRTPGLSYIGGNPLLGEKPLPEDSFFQGGGPWFPRDLVGGQIGDRQLPWNLGNWRHDVPGFASGGVVNLHPGKPQGSDTVPAWLTPQEYVVNAASATANRSLLERINAAKGPLHMADGGPVWDRVPGDPFAFLLEGYDQILDVAETIGEPPVEVGPGPKGPVERLKRKRRFGGLTEDDIRGRMDPFGPAGLRARSRSDTLGRDNARFAMRLFRQRQLLAQSQNPFAAFGLGRADERSSLSLFDRGIQGRQSAFARAVYQDQESRTAAKAYAALNNRESAFAHPAFLREYQGRLPNFGWAFARGYAIGGPVSNYMHSAPLPPPPRSSEDRVPAYLSEGEYVLPRSTVQRYGLPAVQSFAEGGPVRASGGVQAPAGQSGPGISPEVLQALQKFGSALGQGAEGLRAVMSSFGDSVGQFKLAMSSFASSSGELAKALQAWSGKLQVQANQQVTLTVQGLDGVRLLQESFKTFVTELIRAQFAQMMRKTFPDVQVQE